MRSRNLTQRARPTSIAINRPFEATQPVSSLQNQINRVFNDFFMNDNWPLLQALPTFSGIRSNIVTPIIDLTETDNEYRVTAELPGIRSEDVDININDNAITISGEKQEDREESGENFLVCERSYGSFQRTIQLPEGANADQAQASFNEGVLTIDIPKREEAVSKSRKLQISASGRNAQQQQQTNRSTSSNAAASAQSGTSTSRKNTSEPVA